MNEEEYWFWLCSVKDIYQDTISRLLRVFQHPEEVYKATEDMLVQSGGISRISSGWGSIS